eukprot:gnl/MRDRNA2_/MRDRNA2_94836_c0_seq1.p1 gnl/MRDRNA2_/MRDRNA2_94836_c0~~gnl/MRDRNA2_/MRDRNA2_94836_c0_seq1.p1  ORF type:complete len:542 (-),score=82.60 gnl/MRDRNA2_/MRDRNA2_94836_c0_seq1:153-1778(-)
MSIGIQVRPFSSLPRFQRIQTPTKDEEVSHERQVCTGEVRGLRFQAAASLKANSLFRHDGIAKLPLFQGRDPRFVGQLLLDVAVEVFQPGDVILREGDSGESMYLLNRGEVEIIVGGNVVAKLRDGSVFGEIALLGVSSRRTATVRAASFCDCRVIQRAVFMRLLQSFPNERIFYEKEARRRMEELQSQDSKSKPKSKSAGNGGACRRSRSTGSHRPVRATPEKSSSTPASRCSSSCDKSYRRSSSATVESEGPIQRLQQPRKRPPKPDAQFPKAFMDGKLQSRESSQEPSSPITLKTQQQGAWLSKPEGQSQRASAHETIQSRDSPREPLSPATPQRRPPRPKHNRPRSQGSAPGQPLVLPPETPCCPMSDASASACSADSKQFKRSHARGLSQPPQMLQKACDPTTSGDSGNPQDPETSCQDIQGPLTKPPRSISAPDATTVWQKFRPQPVNTGKSTADAVDADSVKPPVEERRHGKDAASFAHSARHRSGSPECRDRSLPKSRDGDRSVPDDRNGDGASPRLRLRKFKLHRPVAELSR